MSAEPHDKLECFRPGQQLRHPGQQTAGRTPVEHAVVKAQRYIRFHQGDKWSSSFIQLWPAARGAHPEQEGLLRQWNGGCPRKTKGAKIRSRGKRTACRVGGELPLVSQLDEFV